MKIYKKSISKGKNVRYFPDFVFFAKFREISNISIENPIENFEKCWKFRKCRKIVIFSGNISQFFTFLDGFFTKFQNF